MKRQVHYRLTSLPQGIGRTLPHSVENEQGVLGSMIIDPSAIAEVAESLTDAHFYVPAHQTIANELISEWKQGRVHDLLTFTAHLRNRKLIEAVGGAAFVTSLYTFVPTAANLANYIEIVRDKYKLREIITACTEIVHRAYEEQDDVEGVCSRAQTVLLEIAGWAGGKSRCVSMRENVQRAFERVESIMLGTVTPGLPTGLPGLDKFLGGMAPGEVIAVTGDTGGGKSALVHQIADHVGVELGQTVQLFSYELPALTVTNRMIANRGRINSEHIRHATMTATEMTAFTSAHDALAKANIFIEDDPRLTMAQVEARARKLKASHNTALIAVDLITKVKVETQGERRQRDIAQISDSIQALAMELNIPVIVLAQWNKRDGSIREAADIVFDAKTLLKIVRDDTKDVEDEGPEPFRDIVVAKNNNGAVGKVSAKFHKRFLRFETLK